MEEHEETEAGGERPSSATHPHLLVVDDDAAFRTALNKGFSKAGYAVTTARDGEEAIRRLQERTFDLMLIDLSMPGKSGLEVVKEMKASGFRMPVIMLTAFGDWGVYATALEYGVYQFVSKPVRLKDLLEMVESALEGKAD